ncbi:MAG: VWA domain-containing protein [Comamonadaceae bacterium]|nr:MAG: VWA domain-containing protein [Comamonadaceae bacterium]
MKKLPSSRRIVALLCAQLVLAGCAQAQPPLRWPEPRPIEPVSAFPRTRPNFQAPSSTHCARPVGTREVPGYPEGQQQARAGMREELAAAAPASKAERRAYAEAPIAESATGSSPTPPPMPAPAASPQLRDGRGAHDGIPQRQWQAPPLVTAGVVDDNADFSAYLAFRNRTRADHRQRDVHARHLLQVRDPRGRPVGDAEVAVLGASGHAMWARTDAGGRVWLHPDAFDPGRSQHYEVAVRKDGAPASARLTRGQKSAVEVVLDAAPAPARARLDLVFLVDATGSMGDEIDKLKASLRAITAEVASLPSRPDICLGLVAYRDRGDAFLLRSHDFTNDVGAFLEQALYPLQAGGGGDYPEAMNEALHETVHQLSWRGDGATRLVILLADAPPHLDYGAPHYDEDMLAALGKGIKLFGVGASGLNRQGEFIQRQMAQYTGGKFVFLTYADAHRPGSGPGRETVHDVKNYSVDTLDRLIVRLVTEELALSGRRPN